MSDLGAYANIEKLGTVAIENGIMVPRCRGYRLMEKETEVPDYQIDTLDMEHRFWILESLCDDILTPEFSSNTKKYIKEFAHGNFYGDFKEIRWDRIHGKRRKILKFEFKKARKQILKQFNTYNKYVGQPDILYIHARIGGNNWNYSLGTVVEKQPWFIERVDDYFDSTYCDIYARIDDRLLDYIKEEYHKSGIVMTEFIRSFMTPLPKKICKKLLEWSGEENEE